MAAPPGVLAEAEQDMSQPTDRSQARQHKRMPASMERYVPLLAPLDDEPDDEPDPTAEDVEFLDNRRESDERQDPLPQGV